jgi:hypothetical protein
MAGANIAVIRRLYEELWNREDLAWATAPARPLDDRLVDPDYLRPPGCITQQTATNRRRWR